MLTLSEKLLLLGLHDEKGSVVFSASTALPYGLAGALLLELYLSEHIDFVDHKITVVDKEKTNSPLLNEVLQLLVGTRKLKDAKSWLKTVHSKVTVIQQRLAEQLVEKGVLSRQEKQFLWLINYKRYPTVDVKPETEVRIRVRDIVLGEMKPEKEDIALLSLIHACDLINEVFTKSERKVAEERVASLIKDQQIGQAISHTMEQITAAITLVIVASAVTTTVST